PSYSGIETGNRSQPYNNWRDFTWTSGRTYLQKRGTTFSTTETLYIGSGVTMGAYGQGQRPIMSYTHAPTPDNTYGFHTLTNQNIVVRDIDFRADDSTAVFYTDAINLVVDNCIFSGDNNYNTFRGGHARNLNNIKLLNSEISNPQDDGIWAAGTTDLEIAYTTIYDVNQMWYTYGRDSTGDNIHIGGDADYLNGNMHIHHNRLDHSSTGYKQIFIIKSNGQPGSNLVFEHNLLIGRKGICPGLAGSENETSNGIALSNVNGATIRYNVVRNTMRGALNSDAQNALFAYNTFEYSCFSGVELRGDSSNTEFYNNVITYYSMTDYTSDTGINYAINAGDSSMVLRNNIIYSEGSKPLFTGASNVDEDYNIFYPDSNLALGTHSQNTNPLFVDVANGDLHLQGNSPAIDAGIDVGISTDLDQHSIVGVPDIGAYEYQGEYQETPSDDFEIVFSQDFNDNPLGTYLRTTWSEDWGMPVDAWSHPCYSNCEDEAEWAKARLTIHEEAGGDRFLRHELAAKLFEPGDSAANWKMPLGNHEELYLTYRVRFYGDDWDEHYYAGKIPALCGFGDGSCSGDALKYEKFMTTFAFSMNHWNELENDQIAFYYTYAGMVVGDQWGDAPDWLTLLDNVPVNEWHTITQRVVMNTPGQENGLMEGFWDGVLVAQKTDMDYRNSSNQYITTVKWDNFLGGSGVNPPDYGEIPIHDFDDFFIYTYKDSVPGIPRGLEPSPAGRVLEIPQVVVQS
ncbi:MAG: right-handed parallel beta-helix repeat-containing protein, partial [Candidatus Heimdallarchaeaceae archaeon]